MPKARKMPITRLILIFTYKKVWIFFGKISWQNLIHRGEGDKSVPLPAHSAHFDEKIHKPQSWCDCDIDRVFSHLIRIWIILSMNYNFLVSEGLQETHMNSLNPFNSNLMILSPRGGLWTFSTMLALCASAVMTRF